MCSISLLKEFKETHWSEDITDQPLELEDDERDLEFEHILRWWWLRCGRSKEFLVLFKDQPLAEACWIHEGDFKDSTHLQEMLQWDQPMEERAST